VTDGRSWFAETVFGLPRRALLVLLVAIAVTAADHAAKLAAAWLEPAAYMHNPAPMVYDWAMLVPAVALLLPSRVTAVLLGLYLGGSASNVADVYLWPGGVPDFIPVGDWVANPADFAIFGGVGALMAWPVWKLFQIARRQYPERTTGEVESPPFRSGPVLPDRDEARPPQANAQLQAPRRERLTEDPQPAP
jgi:hypothetical protein